ncbi:MAG: hypothetical protein ABSG25_11650 [Bryobacteraceae bacterium]
MFKTKLRVFFIFLSAAALGWAGPITYTVTPLGVLPGDSYSYATGINNSGQVTGSSCNSTNHCEAFLYSPGTGMTGLGFLPGYNTTSYATGINDSGQVVGYSVTSTGWNGEQAFLYSSGTGMTGLGFLPGGSFSYAYGINNSGQVVGSGDSSVGVRAFVDSGGTGMTRLDLDFLNGDYLLFAYGINDSGQVVGDGRFGGFLYSSGTGVTWLGSIPGGLGSGEPTGINDSGQVGPPAATLRRFTLRTGFLVFLE